MRQVIPLASVLGMLVLGCGAPEEQAAPGSDATGLPPDSGNFETRLYERTFVFASLEGDSVFIVPWMMRTMEEADTVTREAQGWLARGGEWDAFYAERWSTPPTREAARILPHGGLHLLVRDGDAIDGIVFEEGSRSLELILGESTSTWTGARGGTFQVLGGAAYLADRRIDGKVLDMARAGIGSTHPGGDWAFLLSGDSAHFVLAAAVEYGGEVDPAYRAWGSDGGAEAQWPEVYLDWRRTEAFPPARRDVPVEWRIRAGGTALDDELRLDGELEAVSAEIQAGEGTELLLPVRAIFEVTGEVRTVDGSFPVRGILVHERR